MTQIQLVAAMVVLSFLMCMAIGVILDHSNKKVSLLNLTLYWFIFWCSVGFAVAAKLAIFG